VPTVTAVRAAGRRRVDVEIDGSAWRTLPAEPVLRAGLRPGRRLDRATLRSLRRELRREEALGIASRLLRSRDRSALSLESRLEQAGVAPAARREALEILERAGILDDRRFAASRAATLAARGYGDAAIRFDLERAGVGDRLLEAALAALAPERERARAIVERRGRGPKSARFLAAKGFGEEAVEAALDERVAPEA
jgi:regulatory protein